MIHRNDTLHLSGHASDVSLTTYILDNSPEVDPQRRRPLVVVCPGGGYAFRSFREAEPVAVRLNALGFHACVLHYSVAPEVFPAALLQVLKAIAHVRENAEAWHVDTDKIAVMGFSAGGHLAASAGVFWSKPHYAELLSLTVDDVKPNALILCYPVITSGINSHGGSIKNLLGDKFDAFKDTMSLERQVDGSTPPSFVWHTWEDDAVPVENALLFFSALRKAGVPGELHIFQRGVHGLSLSSDEVYGPDARQNIRPEQAHWIDMAAAWLKAL